MKADVAVSTPAEIAAMAKTFETGEKAGLEPIRAGMSAIVGVYALTGALEDLEPKTEPVAVESRSSTETSGGAAVSPAPLPAATPPPASQDPAAAASTPPAGGPMGFFAPKKTGDAPVSSAPPPAPSASASIVPAPPEKALPAVTLDPAVEDILRKAGMAAQEALAQGDKDAA